MHQLLTSGGLEVISGSGQERLESLAFRRNYPEDKLLQWLLKLMAEPVNVV
jgi:hypothetical protein